MKVVHSVSLPSERRCRRFKWSSSISSKSQKSRRRRAERSERCMLRLASSGCPICPAFVVSVLQFGDLSEVKEPRLALFASEARQGNLLSPLNLKIEDYDIDVCLLESGELPHSGNWRTIDVQVHSTSLTRSYHSQPRKRSKHVRRMGIVLVLNPDST